jgi:hypothetical protein
MKVFIHPILKDKTYSICFNGIELRYLFLAINSEQEKNNKVNTALPGQDWMRTCILNTGSKISCSLNGIFFFGRPVLWGVISYLTNKMPNQIGIYESFNMIGSFLYFYHLG